MPYAINRKKHRNAPWKEPIMQIKIYLAVMVSFAIEELLIFDFVKYCGVTSNDLLEIRDLKESDLVFARNT